MASFTGPGGATGAYQPVAIVHDERMLRFMPVGDSMTIGSAGEHTWRFRLWQHLRTTHDGPFKIVGPRETLYDKATDTPTSYEYADTDPRFPRAHLAGWGEGWLHMAPLIADAIRAHRANVLLVSLGLIDLGFYTNAEQTAENTRRFVEAAREANPHVRMVLLPVTPNVRAESDAPFAAQVARFNELLGKTAADLDEPRSPSSWPRHPRRTTSTGTPTTAPTPTPPANTRSRRPSRTRCTRRGGWGDRTRSRDRPVGVGGAKQWPYSLFLAVTSANVRYSPSSASSISTTA